MGLILPLCLNLSLLTEKWDCCGKSVGPNGQEDQPVEPLHFPSIFLKRTLLTCLSETPTWVV